MSSGFQIYRWPLRWPPGTRLPVAVLTNERRHNKTPLPKWFWLIWKINRCASKNSGHGIFKEDKEMNDEEGSQRFSGLAAPARSGLTFQIKKSCCCSCLVSSVNTAEASHLLTFQPQSTSWTPPSARTRLDFDCQSTTREWEVLRPNLQATRWKPVGGLEGLAGRIFSEQSGTQAPFL